MKRTIALLLITVLLIGAVSCNQNTGVSSGDLSAASSQAQPLDSPEAEVDTVNAAEYLKLNEICQSIYSRILYAAKELNMSYIFLPAETVMSDIDAAFNAVIADYPELFWLQKSLTMVTEADRVIIVLDYSVSSREELAVMQSGFDEAVSEALSILPAAADEFTRELLLHDWVVNRVTYSDEAAASNSGEYPWAYTAYGALVEGSAVCEGYARALQLLLRETGISCSLISGAAGGDEHTWNLVTIGGAQYHLDPTWNDTFKTDGEQESSHIYFNLTDSEISVTHSNYDSPGCANTEYNYFVQKGRCFDGYDDNTKNSIAAALTQNAAAGELMLEIRFSSLEEVTAAYSDLVEQGGIFALLRQANEQMETPVLDASKVHFGSYDTQLYVITILAVLA